MSTSLPKKTAKAARKAIKRMRRDPVKWRVAEHIFESLGKTHHITAQGCYVLASQIVDDITPLILGATEEDPAKD